MSIRIAFIAIAVLGGVVTFGQTSEQTEIRNLNETVLRHHEAARTSRGAAQQRRQASLDFVKREAALASLIESDPDAALGMAFSEDLAAELKTAFPESAAHIESRQTWTGTIETAVEDDHRSGSHTVHRLKSGGRTMELYSGSAVTAASGSTVKVTGIQVAGKVAAASFTPQAAVVAAGTNGVTGQQNIVTILVNFPGYTLPTGVDAEYMKGVLYGNAWSTKQNTPDMNVDDFWQQNSDGKASAPFSSGKVVGPYLMKSNYNQDSKGGSFCDYITMRDAVVAAADADVNFTQFNRIVIVMPNNSACTWSGVSSIGYWASTSADGAISASFSWLRADQLATRSSGVQLATHELGHGLGLNHARTREYPGSPRITLGAIGAAGTLNEYGDNFSAMGTGPGFYGAEHAQQILGWLAPLNYTEVRAAGTYTIAPYETRNAASAVKALRVLRDATSNSWLWIEYRTNAGVYDSQLNSQVWTGALIHYEDATTGAYTGLLDFTPSTTSFLDPALAAGQTWTDPYSKLSIAATGIAGGALTLTVNYGTAVCTPANPTVTLSPANPTVSASGSTALTVTVKNNNSSSCPVSAYSLTSVQPAGFSGKLSATSLNIAGGASGTATLTETVGTTVGTFALSVTATDTATGAGNTSGIGSTNITVAAVCTAANPTVTISPSGISVSAGASTALTVTLKNNNSSACAATGFNLAAVQPAGFSGTFSNAAIAALASGSSGSVTLTEKAGTTGGTFTVSVTGTDSARSTSKATGTASVTVNVQATCVAVAPVVALSPAKAWVILGGSATYSINVTNSNASICGTTAYAIAAVQPTGLTGSLSATTLTLAAGASGTVTMTVVSGAKTGSLSTIVNVTAGTLKASATAITTVSAAPTKTGITNPAIR